MDVPAAFAIAFFPVHFEEVTFFLQVIQVPVLQVQSL